jgi:glycosyltransferase involved in cell wall biosynthesis
VGPSLDILGGQAIQLQRLLEKLKSCESIQADFLPVNPRLPGFLGRLQSVKYVRTLLTSLAYGLTLLRTVPRYDVVHAFSASYWSFVVAPLPALLIGRIMGKRVVLNYRSGEAEDHLTRWRWLVVPAMRLASAIVVPSGYLVSVFARFGLPATAISNFVDVDGIVYRERLEPAPIFLSNRNLQPMYNVACTLRAFALIQRAVPESRLLVAGFGPERERLELLARELGVSRVEFLGKKDPGEMAAVYDRADIYLNSPDIDNMPTSVLEAFAAGLPVVTTSAGGIPFLVRHERNGLVVACGDHESLAVQALRLIADPQLAARLASSARSECMARFVWPAVKRQWEQFYQGLPVQGGGARN